MKHRCKNFAAVIEFGKIVKIDTDYVEIIFRSRCQRCRKIIEKGTYIYRFQLMWTNNLEAVR